MTWTLTATTLPPDLTLVEIHTSLGAIRMYRRGEDWCYEGLNEPVGWVPVAWRHCK